MSAGARWPRRGEIWWVFMPGQPSDPHQPRPALVVSVDARNRLADDLIVVPIFSSGRLGPTPVPLTNGVGGLAHDRVLFCEEVTTIVRDFLSGGPLGPPVPPAVLVRAVAGIANAINP